MSGAVKTGISSKCGGRQQAHRSKTGTPYSNHLGRRLFRVAIITICHTQNWVVARDTRVVAPEAASNCGAARPLLVRALFGVFVNFTERVGSW